MQTHTCPCRVPAAAAALAIVLAACEYAGPVVITPVDVAADVRTVVLVDSQFGDPVMRAGHSVRVAAVVTDRHRVPVFNVPVVWFATGNGSITPDGFSTGSDGILTGTWRASTTAGLQAVLARVEGSVGVFDSVAVRVFADTVVGMLKVQAVSTLLPRGDTTRVRVTEARDRYGNPYLLAGNRPDSPPDIEFSSLDAGVAGLVSTTARSALVAGLSAGTARIVARSGGRTDTVTIVVAAPGYGAGAEGGPPR